MISFISIVVLFLALFVIMEYLVAVPSSYYIDCYANMEKEGYAAMNCCRGKVGGTSSTDYLSETCISCPYYIFINKEE